MTQWSLDILSAFYGPLDVTDAVQDHIEKAFANSNLSGTTLSIIPTNALFQTDPLPGHRKSFVVLYRINSYVDVEHEQNGHPSFANLRRAVCEEGQECSINLELSQSAPDSFFAPPTTYLHNVPFIINASYYTKDVTDIVRQHFNHNVTLSVSNRALGGDPIVNTKKSLVINWAYVDEHDNPVFEPQSAIEGNTMTRLAHPEHHGHSQAPLLTIKTATYAGINVTDKIQALVDPNQTVTVDMTRILQICGMTSDPWPAMLKSLNVLYQWEGRNLELFTAADWSGTHRLDPTVPVNPLRKAFFNVHRGRTAGRVNIIAVVWGINQGAACIPRDNFQQIATRRKFTPSNAWFGFDGWPNVVKTATVFYQYGLSGPIRSASSKEGVELVLADPYGALDPLPAKGLLDISDQSKIFGFRLKSPHTNAYIRVLNNGLSALAKSPEDAAIFAIKGIDGLPPRLAVYLPNQVFAGWIGAESDGTIDIKKEAQDALQVDYEFSAKWGSDLCLFSFYRGTSRPPEVLVARDSLTRLKIMSVDSVYGVFGAGFEVEFVLGRTDIHPQGSRPGQADWVPPPNLLKLLVVDPFAIIQNRPVPHLSAIVGGLMAWCLSLPAPVKASLFAAIRRAKQDPALAPYTAVKLSISLIILLYKEGHLYTLFQRIWLSLGADSRFFQRLAGSYAAILNAKSFEDLGLGLLGISIKNQLKSVTPPPPAHLPLRAKVEDKFSDEL